MSWGLGRQSIFGWPLRNLPPVLPGALEENERQEAEGDAISDGQSGRAELREHIYAQAGALCVLLLCGRVGPFLFGELSSPFQKL